MIGYGISFGTVLAITFSWGENKSIFWAIVHGLFGWLYVIYFALGTDEDFIKSASSNIGQLNSMKNNRQFIKWFLMALAVIFFICLLYNFNIEFRGFIKGFKEGVQSAK